jgi:aminoglycoside phosphotransferase (APT) family kinase protein/8-oxo-dGTP pyrophosphatase MutT (NUDIX family)
VDEIVALYDETGRPAGRTSRSVMRAQNLHHAATGVLVRDDFGRVYVHRRTPTKDVYPSRWDFTAGGVVLDGEDPLEAARRELAEELGVTSELEPLGEATYADQHTSYHAFRYVTTWNGPITPQPEEVAYGAWLSVDRLLERLADPDVSFMPDTVALFGGWLRERAADRSSPQQGWDSVATIIEGRWLDREPRYPDVADLLRAETVLCQRLADRLPLPIPQPIVLDEAPLRVRHVLVPGRPAGADVLDAEAGRLVGRFLRILHDLPEEVHAGSGIPDALSARAELLATLDRMLHRVLPLVPEEDRATAKALLHDVARRTPVTLVHGDLGPDHVLAHEGAVSGIIDWSDARVADPALDLAWVLYGAPEDFAEAAAQAYRPTDDELSRALRWYRFGPWYEVLYGQASGGPEFVESGLKGLLDRL